MTLGDLRLAIMTYAKAGDVLALHNHARDNVHITVVARGSVKVSGPTIPVAIHKAGAVIDFQEDHPHEIVALEDNSRIVNILKYFRPA